MCTRNFVLFLLPLAILLGCTQRPAPVKVQPPKASDQVKTALQDLAQRGEITSGIGELKTNLEAMKATDSAKATALLADCEELVTLTTPDAIKAKAQEMLGKL